MKAALFAGLLSAFGGAGLALAQTPSTPADEVPIVDEERDVPETMTAEQSALATRRAVDSLIEQQRPDGSFSSGVIESVWEAGFAIETYYAWQVSSQGLALRAMLAVDETPERRASLDAGARWFLTTRMPKRGDHWDVDYMWSMVYGLDALVDLAADARFQDGDWPELIEARGREFVDLLERNQSFMGGWGYYDDPPYTQRPKWGTVFSTAAVLPALEKALAMGWHSDKEKADAMLARSLDYVQRCALPNGAYAYDLSIIPRVGGESINDVKGSLGRIQVANWARRELGDQRVTNEAIREGLEAFFREHAFLDVAFMRPIPHEAYYANAAYFYHFGHYYAAEVIELLPEAERAKWHAKLRPELVKTQRKDGSLTDFLGTGYLRVASTAFTILALERGKDD